MDSNSSAILKTLLYFDIFDYPLKKEEIHKFLVNNKSSKKESFSYLENKKNEFEESKGYFYLKGREKIISLRKSREKISFLKFKKAKQIIKKITFLPSIKFIGISGALSMQNSHIDDDIDIFVIAEKNLVWTTRFLLIIVLKFLGVYRSNSDKLYKDKICLNMVVAENKIKFDNKNFYTAHEIAQLIPLFDKDRTYEKFIKSNNWIYIFLPNAKPDKRPIFKENTSSFDKFCIFIFNLLNLEKVFQFIQYNYMKKKISKEVIKDGFLGFHPFDYENYVLNKYAKKAKEYRLKI